MAEETNVKRRLEQRLSEYMQQRKAQRGKAALAFMGVNTDPSIDQMAEYNKSLQPFVKELVGLQSKIYDNEKDRRKERAATLRSMMSRVQAIMNNRATNATGAMKAKLMARSRNIDAYIKGLDLVEQDETGVTDMRVDDDKLRKYTIDAQMKATRKLQRDPRGAGLKLAQNIPNADQRQQAIDSLYLQAAKNEEQGVRTGITRKDVDMIKEGSEQAGHGTTRLTDEEQIALGVEPGTMSEEDMSWIAIGRSSAVDPDDVGAAFAVEQQVIDSAQAGHGGSFGAVMAELVRGTTSGSTEDVQEALNDLVGEMGLTEQELSSMDSAEQQRELLLGQIYNPNAPAAVEVARDALLQDPGFLQYKQAMGFYTDRAAVRGLKRQLRKERRTRKRNDRQILRQTRFDASPQAIDAMKALQENEDRTKRLADDAVASKSATLAQNPEPESTTAKTEDQNGRRTQDNPFYSGS